MLIVENLMLLAFILLFSAACWGLGSTLSRDSLHSMRILIGITALLFFIGLMNLVGIAYLAILSLPLAYGVYEVFSSGRRMLKEGSAALGFSKEYLTIGLILTVAWLLCASTVAFPEAYNFHDDYQKYFIQPVKILETGSFYGSTLSTVGKETFGAQAALQALFIGFVGLSTINAFDAVFCLLLASFLLLEFSLEKKQLLLGSIATTLLVVIHTQYVNITSIYSFVCFAIGTVILHDRLLSSNRSQLSVGLALGFGALYASAIALKTPNGFFAIAHFPIVALSLVSLGHEIKSVFRWSVLATFAGILAVLPWAVRTIYLATTAPGADGMSLALTPDLGNLLLLLSSEASFYGGTPILYTLLLFAGFALLVLVLIFGNKGLPANVWTSGAALVSATLVLIYAVAFVGKEQHQFIQTLRYSVPILIGLAPIALLILGITLEHVANEQENMGKALQAAGLLTPICLVLLWLPTKFEVIKQSSDCGSELSFPKFACSQPYRDYNNYVLGGAAEERVNRLQSLVPEGATIMSWLNYSHLLDFNRNLIIEVDTAGLRNPWAVMPDVEYLMLDVSGYATLNKAQLEHARVTSMSYERDIKQAALNFTEYLEKNVSADEILANEQDIIVYKIRIPENRKFKSDSDA